MNIKHIIGIGLIMISVVLFIFGVIELYSLGEDGFQDIKVKCYDRHNNVIEGLTCTERVSNPIPDFISSLLFIGGGYISSWCSGA